MRRFIYVSLPNQKCWACNVNSNYVHDSIYLSTLLDVAPDAINIHNKDNLDKALLLISLGLPHKEIEELLKESQ